MTHAPSRHSVLTAAHWGPVRVETDGERIFASYGELPTAHQNSLQTVVHDQVHSKTRVRFPMVRKGFLASPDKPQGIRGQDEFVRVSWDDALDLIHAQRQTYSRKLWAIVHLRRLLRLAFERRIA